MPELKKSRPHFTAEEKLAILHMRRLLAPEMPVITLCKKVGITPKTYYEWEKAYAANGLNGLKPAERKSYGDVTTRAEVIEAVLGVARLQPYLPSAKLHAEINRQHRITHYALRRILSDHRLDSIESRVGAVEQAIIRGSISPGSDELKSLFKVNPCLEDWYRMGERPRYPIGLDAIPLGKKSALPGYYLILAIDFDSLYIRGLLTRGKSTGAGMPFLCDSAYGFRRNRGTLENLVIFGKVPNSIIREYDRCDIQRHDKSNNYIQKECSGRSSGAITVVNEKVRTTLLPILKEKLTIDEAQAVLTSWLDEHNNQPGSPLYPTFGRKPANLLSEHTRLAIRSLPVDLEIHNSARDFRKQRIKEAESIL